MDEPIRELTDVEKAELQHFLDHAYEVATMIQGKGMNGPDGTLILALAVGMFIEANADFNEEEFNSVFLTVKRFASLSFRIARHQREKTEKLN